MDKQFKFVLPSPNFNKNIKNECKPKPHYLTPSGMSLLPREKQPPPMYGKHGATLPAKYLKHHAEQTEQNTLTTSAPEKHYCEPCEIELHSLDDLKRHRSQHEKCPVAGCLYKGHPSVMDKHVNSLHASGLFDKFKKLSTPEEIAAWRNERRKRYPTLANVLLKQKAKEQKQKRGERLEESKSRFGKVNDRKRAQSNVRENKGPLEDKKPRDENKKNSKGNRKRKYKNKSKNLESKPKVQVVEKEQNEVDEDDTGLNCDGITMFRGTSKLKNYEHFNEKNKVAPTNALFGLVGMYGSDDDESTGNDSYNEDEGVNVETINVMKNNAFHSNNDLSENCTQNQDIEDKELRRNCSNNDFTKGCDFVKEKKETVKESVLLLNDTSKDVQETSTLVLSLRENASNTVDKQLCDQRDKSSDDDAPEEAPIQRTVQGLPLQPKQEPLPAPLNQSRHKCIDLRTQKMVTSRQKQSKKSGLDYRKARLRKQNTLLEKLLESDIRHERNVLLQSIRFVCENNFFNIGHNENQKSPDKNKL